MVKLIISNNNMDLNRLLHIFENDKRIKIVKNKVPFDKNYQILDISLAVGRNQEDTIFKQDPQLVNLLRRGTSFIMSAEDITWARKGLPKFFELNIEKSINKASENSSTPLSSLIKDIRTGQVITIYQTTKANGENAQISYNTKTQSWIIGSKNVCLAARDKHDLDYYTSLRYNFAKLIAEAWFEIIKLKSSQELEDIKNDLHDCTLVGEYIGNANFQHIIQYKEIIIHFFAKVNHYSESICESPRLVVDLLNKHAFPSVKIEKLDTYCNDEEFIRELNKISTEVANSSLDDRQEGSVLYFSDDFECISLCKVKTLEYKILRKLREKTKLMENRRESSDKLYNEFCTYIQKIEKKYSKNYANYIELAKNMFRDILNKDVKASEIQYNFASSLSGHKTREIYISIGIPGIGKSKLFEALQVRIPELVLISSDNIRGELLSNLSESNPLLNNSELYSRTNNDYKKRFNELVVESTGKIYIDKNFPPNSIKGFCNLIKNCPTKVIAFVPKCNEECIDSIKWPISLEVLYSCILRLIKRENHPTLTDPINSISVALMMYNLYRGYTFTYYIQAGVSNIIPIDFVDENILIPQEVRSKMIEILKICKPGTAPSQSLASELFSLIPNAEIEFRPIIIPNLDEKIPVFLGIEINDFPILSLVLASLSQIYASYNNQSIQDDILTLSKSNTPFSPNKLLSDIWKFPQSMHVTTLYIGRNSKVLHSIHYKSFVPGVSYRMILSHIVYIPSKIICAPVEFTDTAPIIANKIPHITLLLGRSPAKTSNQLLEMIDLQSECTRQATSLGECYILKLQNYTVTGISRMFSP